jgi:hypothetical protein
MSRKPVAIASAAALAAGAAVALAVAAPGQQTAARTLTFSAAAVSPADDRQIDVGPRGFSIGDRSLGSQTLRDGARPVGRLEGDCVILDATYNGQQCVITLLLSDGQITTQGAGVNRPLPGVRSGDGAGDQYAITGGTGRYAGASGTLTMRPGRNGDTVTVALRG